MNHNRHPDFQSLCVLLVDCIEMLQKDIIRIKCAHDTGSVRKWTAVLDCAMACRKIVESIENNEFGQMDANIRACRQACKKCILYCSTSALFSNSYRAAYKILPQLLVYSHESES